MSSIKTQLFTKKNDAFYEGKAQATSASVTRIEEGNTIINKVDNLYAHAVAVCDVIQDGVQVIDGYTVKDGDFVLCVGQLIAKRRGLMRVNGAGDWTFTDNVLHSGIAVAVAFGNTYAGSVWVCQEPKSPAPQNTVDITWVRQGEYDKGESFMWRKVRQLVRATFDRLLCLIEETAVYECVLHYSGFYDRYGGAPNVKHILPFQNFLYKPSDGRVVIGADGGFYFYPNRSGYWDVDIYVEDVKVAPAGYVVQFFITGPADSVKVCSWVLQAGESLQVQGSRKVWCDGDGSPIQIEMQHNYLVPGGLYLNDTAFDAGGTGYVSIHFCGKPQSAVRF